MRMTRSDRIFITLNYILMLIVILCSVYPIWYCIILSVSNLNTVSVYEISFWPIEFTAKNYEQVFKDTQLLNSIKISLARTVLGAGFHVLCCAMAAYALSRREMIFNKFFTTMLLITMFFGGGMIPKLQGCIDAIGNGVSRVHIMDGRIPHCLLLEIFTNKGIGTAILGENKEKFNHEDE